MEEFCELFPLFSLLLLTKIFLNGTAGSVSIIFPISDCWKLRWKKHYCWSGMTERPFFCPSCLSFPHWRQDKAHIFAVVSAIMVKRSGAGFYLAPKPCGAGWCHCSQPGLRGTGRAPAAQREAGATCSSSPLISYTDLLMGSSKGVPQKTRQIPAARRELTARLISCKIFTRGSYSRFCFPSANEAAGNERIEWKKSFSREWGGNWNSAQSSLEPGLCPGHLEITLVSVKASL